jgi:hypothetical protein
MRVLKRRAFPRRLPPARPGTAGRRSRPSPHAPAADVVLGYAADQVSAIRSRDPMVRRNAPDAVHLAGENAFSYGILYEQDACRAADLEQQARHAWKPAKRPARRWLS